MPHPRRQAAAQVAATPRRTAAAQIAAFARRAAAAPLVRVARRALPLLAAAAACLILAGCADDRPLTATVVRSTPDLPGRTAQDAAVKRFAAVGRPIRCGAGRRRLVALTFDDGPGPYTGNVLRELRRAGAHATFFVVGVSVQRFPQLMPRERKAAAIGDHTMTHPNLPTLTDAAARAEIAGGRAVALHEAGGPVDLFRPPYGSRTAAIDREVQREGMAQILWSVDSADSRRSPPADFHEIAARAGRNSRPGSIVLMHENRGQTVRALRAILPALKRRKLRTVTVPELLAADPPSPAQLAAGLRGCDSPAARNRARRTARAGLRARRAAR
jgi:peptidoglycan/xylan/chitin deacetylase (PgdA/CDA1 family)